MKKYIITIEELVSQDFEVEASSLKEAWQIARKKYTDCEFVLEPGCLEETTINAIDIDTDEQTGFIAIKDFTI